MIFGTLCQLKYIALGLTGKKEKKVMTQMKIKHFAIYTNNVDSLSLNPEKYKSCLTVMLQVKLFCYSGQCIFTHL